MKRCSKCQKTKAVDEFSKNQAYCKPCARNYYLANSDRRRHVKGTKRTCRNCELTLPLSQFTKRRKSGYRESYCKPCIALLGHGRNIARFSITPEQYIDMLTEQNNVCKICKQSDSRRLAVDHDHKCCNGNFSCGKCIRGLLCSRCNRALGNLNDDPALIKSMLDYLSFQLA